MKVLLIGPFPPVVNGVTVSNDFLFRWLTQEGDTVSRINTETGKIASRQGDRISLTKIITFLSIYLDLFRIIGKDVVYITPGQTFWGLAKYTPFIFLCRLLNTPYVLHIHGGYICMAYKNMTRRKKYLFGYLVNGSSSVIALSHSLAEELKETFRKAVVHVVENFYDPLLISPALVRKESDIPRFLFLSNLMLGKGVLEFLDALLILQGKGMNFTVALAGAEEKGMGETLRQKCKALGDKVTFFGLADFHQKKSLLYTSDIFVLPTWYIMEGQPLSIIEAYVTGNAVISTHQGGIVDISKYETFFYTPPQDSVKLAEVMEEVCTKLPYLNDKLIVTAKHAQNRFTPHWFGKKIKIVLEYRREDQK